MSVILATYNGASTIDMAIDSIVKQSFTDWELIVCDDGSTDGTYPKLLEWQEKDNRIRVVRNGQNLGIAAASNHCLRYVAGQYIAKMDDDDVSDPRRFALQVLFLDSHQSIAFCGTGYHLYDGTTMQATPQLIPYPQKKDFLWNQPFLHPSCMFRRNAIDAVNGYRTAKETARAEDYDMLMRMYALGLKGCNLPEPCYCYRVTLADMKKKRRYRFRVDECVVRWKGFSKLGILFPVGWIFVLKPLFVGLLPHRMLYRIHRKDICDTKDLP
ncbi:glycosyltransferase family 2 protein [Bengtsoniella intestinalis]|uniref:glycosyltransferase family 2 protein n=1 Tax=Bengtsoniella intestinalis TaxID=3073143 RepID=UPI00391FA573